MKSKIIALSSLSILAVASFAVLSTGIGTASTSKSTRTASALSSTPATPSVQNAGKKQTTTSPSVTKASPKPEKPNAEQRQAKEQVSDLTTTQKSKDAHLAERRRGRAARRYQGHLHHPRDRDREGPSVQEH